MWKIFYSSFQTLPDCFQAKLMDSVKLACFVISRIFHLASGRFCTHIIRKIPCTGGYLCNIFTVHEQTYIAINFCLTGMHIIITITVQHLFILSSCIYWKSLFLLFILFNRCCYIKVDSAMVASQNGFCSYKLSIHKKTNIMQVMIKNITFFLLI